MAKLSKIQEILQSIGNTTYPVQGTAAVEPIMAVGEAAAHINFPTNRMVGSNNSANATTIEETAKTNPPAATILAKASLSEQLDAALKTLVRDKDFGKLPGIQKDVLFKSGALKIIKAINAHKTETLVDKTVDSSAGLIAYTVKVQIISSDGEILAEAHGSANSLEKSMSSQGYSSDARLITMATKRGLVTAVKELLACK